MPPVANAMEAFTYKFVNMGLILKSFAATNATKFNTLLLTSKQTCAY